jgi:hypothetical protein
MVRLRCTARKSVIPFLPSRLVEHPLRHTVTGQSSHLERLHHRLHEEQEHRRQEREQHDSSPSPQQEVESRRQPSSVHQLEVPLHHHRTPQLLEETLMETTTTVAVRATTRSFRRSSRKDGSPDPWFMMPLAVVISTMLSTTCRGRSTVFVRLTKPNEQLHTRGVFVKDT